MIRIRTFLLASLPAVGFAWQAPAPPNPTQIASEADRQQMLGQLKITEPLRKGADGRNKEAPNYANYDESKANPYPKLPDPLVMNNGKKVTSAKMHFATSSTTHASKSTPPAWRPRSRTTSTKTSKT